MEEEVEDWEEAIDREEKVEMKVTEKKKRRESESEKIEEKKT